MGERTCSIDGCDKTHRARGLCSTHYNQVHQPAWHAPQATPCVVCGTVVQRGVKTDRRHVCSVDCRAALTAPGLRTQRYDWTLDAMRRARKAGATVISRVDRIAVLDRDGWRCQICDKPLSLDVDPLHPDAPTIDHVIPLALGGAHTESNTQAACLRCNSAKQDRVPSVA